MVTNSEIKSALGEVITIVPLNAKHETYAELFDASTPPQVSIRIASLVMPDVPIETVERRQLALHALIAAAIDPDEGDPLGLLRNAPCQILNVATCVHRRLLIPDLQAVFTPEQTAWVTADTYHQTVLYVDREECLKPDHDGAILAMTLQDGLVCRHRLLQPGDHASLVVSRELAVDSTALIGDLYTSGRALWRRGHINLRNEFQIAVRAMASGDDVLRRLEEFRNRGTEYFLF